MRLAALIKQIPAFEEMELGPDGRLVREGLDLEMNPYCRRAVAQVVELAATVDGEHECVFVTLGPPSAEDALREALAWAIERGVSARGLLVTDPSFAGSDTLATARALAAALGHEGSFDLVFVGRNSVDADTGQVGPELAELLDLPFLTGVRELHLGDGIAEARCELDDGWVQAKVALPAVLSTAERLIEPCKADPVQRATVPAELLRTVSASELGPGPWGQAGSPTWVGEVRVHELRRDRQVLTGPIDAQAAFAVKLLAARGALTPGQQARESKEVPVCRGTGGASVAVLVEPGRPHDTRELLGAAAELATAIGGHTAALHATADDDRLLMSWGADEVVAIDGAVAEEDVGRAVSVWAREAVPWAILAPSTAWGREVTSRVAAALGSGLTGDAVGLEERGGRLVAWKPAFGGQLLASIEARSSTQMATVRVGVLPQLRPRRAEAPEQSRIVTEARGRVTVLKRTRDDDVDTLAEAQVVVGVGQGVNQGEYAALQPLLEVLGAQLGATRKVTDKGWLPRSRQIGITGRTITPRLYVTIGTSGKFNHMAGVRAAATVLAINADPDAMVFSSADVGIVGDWREAVPALVNQLGQLPTTT